MNWIKGFILSGMILLFAEAETVNFSGYIKDTQGNPVSRAYVVLENGLEQGSDRLLATYSGQTGFFKLASEVTASIREVHQSPEILFSEGTCNVTLYQSENITFQVFTIRGEQLYHEALTLAQGKHVFSLPGVPQQIYIYHVRAGKKDMLFKGFRGNSFTVQVLQDQSSFNKNSSFKQNAEPVTWIIKVSKENFTTKRIQLDTPDSSGIEIVLENSIPDSISPAQPDTSKDFIIKAGSYHMEHERSTLIFDDSYVGQSDKWDRFKFVVSSSDPNRYFLKRLDGWSKTYANYLTSSLTFGEPFAWEIGRHSGTGFIVIKNPGTGEYIAKSNTCKSSSVHTNYSCNAAYDSIPALLQLSN